MSFLNNKKVPAAMLDIKINPRNYFVNRVSRMFRPENETIRRSIRFGLHSDSNSKKLINGTSAVYDSANPQKKYIRCNKDDVICTLSESASVKIIEMAGFPLVELYSQTSFLNKNSNWKELAFKCRVLNAPETQALYFLLYDDPYHTSLSEVWRVLVHSLHR